MSVVADRRTEPNPASTVGSGRRRLPIGALVGLLLAGAVALRLFFAVGPHSSPEGDEAIVGLMAVRLLHGELPSAFYWHQSYGGSLESVVVAPFVALFGTTTLGLRSASVIFELVTSFLVWRVARHLLRPVTAVCAALVSLFFPLAAVLYGTKERGFYPMSAALGLAAVLMAIHVHERPSDWRYWAGLGLAAGVGWWMSPNIAYYALPMIVWLVVRGHWRQGRNALVAAAAFSAGSSVWIVANIHSGLASLLRPPPVGGSSTFPSRFGFFWTHGLPFALGLRPPASVGGWYVHTGVGVSVYLVTLVAFAFAVRRTKLRDAPDLFLLAASPFVFAAFIGNWQLIEGRYAYFIASMIPFAIGRIIEVSAGRVVVAVLLAVGTLGFVAGYGSLVGGLSGSTEPLARAIAARGYRTAVGQYSLAYKMTYESDELVVASPLPGMVGLRYQPYERKVLDSRPAYLFGSGAHCDSAHPERLRRALEHERIEFTVVTRGSYCAILPATRYIPGR